MASTWQEDLLCFLVKLLVFLCFFDKEMFTKCNKNREMKVVGEGDQSKEACWATSVSSETPAGNHSHKRINQTVQRLICLWGCVMCTFVFVPCHKQQAAVLCNHQFFLKLDISVAMKSKSYVTICVPCLAHQHTGVGFTAGFNCGQTAEEEHSVQ